MFVNSTQDFENLLEVSLEPSKQIQDHFPHSPISRYNYFVVIYNNEINFVDSQLLSQMQTNKAIESFYLIKERKFCFCIYFILIFLVPFLNLILVLFLMYVFIKLSKNMEIFTNNASLIPNPFQRMVYSPTICLNLNKDHWFFEIEIKSLPGFFLNPDILENLQKEGKDGVVKFMIYNDDFKNLNKEFPSERRKSLRDVFMGVILLIFSGIMYFLYIFWIVVGFY